MGPSERRLWSFASAGGVTAVSVGTGQEGRAPSRRGLGGSPAGSRRGAEAPLGSWRVEDVGFGDPRLVPLRVAARASAVLQNLV